MKSETAHHVDYVVVGCGVAGLRAAIELCSAGSVLVLAKSALGDSATNLAQGGIAAALSDDDEVSLHEQDTMQAGDGLCRPAAVKTLVEEGPQYIQELIEWGTQFDRAGTKLAFTREAAHSRSRILHAQGDSTGREIARALLARAQTEKAICIRPFALTTELRLEKARVSGLSFLDETIGEIHHVDAGAVLLATGGLGYVFSETTNPDVATGDGMAIAYQAGALLSDLEFVQFHPTALAVKGAPRFLLSEALRGEGAILRNVNLERFMKRYNEAQELAPRDVVARAIVSEMHRTRSDFVYLDMTAKSEEFLKKRFPRIYATCQQYGLELATDLAPVRPAAHYSMGGVKTDLWGRTSLHGLYAAGETAVTGVHGANRLASNSLLEGLVFGARAGAAMIKDFPAAKKKAAAAANPGKRPNRPGNSEAGNHVPPPSPASVNGPLTQIRELMWKSVGIMRNGKDLAHALEKLRAFDLPAPQEPSRHEAELRNILALAQLITRSALAREESRGSHYRSDFPYRNDEDFQKHSVLACGKEVRFEP
ncbi:MAG TPA: L-aspartate oxidase [Candidatus Acidoferrales bacterium]|nr:L-aspartate oxidase [Candidatus Acidoferrales bacterium]